MSQLKCPYLESTRYLCDREAAYAIDAVVWCHIHARQLMLRRDADYYHKAIEANP